MTNILVPKVFGFAKIFRFSFFSAAFFSAIVLPLSNVIKIIMTSHTSLKTFKTSFMILNKLGSFYLVSMSLASSDVRCLGTE